MIPVKNQPADGTFPTIRLTDVTCEFWRTDAPVWKSELEDISVNAWAAVTLLSLRFHVVVNDPEHKNDFHERNIWKGDSIYISLDGRGNSTKEELLDKNL
jgi:hypothetical protein